MYVPYHKKIEKLKYPLELYGPFPDVKSHPNCTRNPQSRQIVHVYY